MLHRGCLTLLHVVVSHVCSIGRVPDVTCEVFCVRCFVGDVPG